MIEDKGKLNYDRRQMTKEFMQTVNKVNLQLTVDKSELTNDKIMANWQITQNYCEMTNERW